MSESDFLYLIDYGIPESTNLTSYLKEFEPISLIQLRDNGLKNIDLSLDIKVIEDYEFIYNGQVKLITNKRRLQQIKN